MLPTSHGGLCLAFLLWTAMALKLLQTILGIVAGITKLGARVGEQVAKNTKLK